MAVPARLYYGWRVVAAVFVAEMFAIGSTSYAFSLFVVPAGGELGLSRAAANVGLVLILLGMGLAAPLIGKALDRFPARLVLVGGALAMGAGLIGSGLAQSPLVMAAMLLFLVGPGAGAIGPLPAATVVSRWFVRRRGKALGVTSVATSLGGTLVVPAIGFNLELFGWREALLIQGAVIAIVVSLVAWLVVRDRPQQLGLLPDGDNAGQPESEGVTAAEQRWPLAAIVTSRDFWVISLAVGFTFAVSQAILASLVPYALDLGIDVQRASLLVALISFFSILGKLGFGAVADRIDKRWLLMIIMAFIIMQLTFLAAVPAMPVLVAALAIGGLATGGEFPVWQALVADRFGRRSYGSVMGCMQLILTLCSLASILFVGHAYDLAGSYSAAFGAFVGVVAIAMLMVLLISPQQRESAA